LINLARCFNCEVEFTLDCPACGCRSLVFLGDVYLGRTRVYVGLDLEIKPPRVIIKKPSGQVIVELHKEDL